MIILWRKIQNRVFTSFLVCHLCEYPAVYKHLLCFQNLVKTVPLRYLQIYVQFRRRGLSMYLDVGLFANTSF